MTKVGTVLNGQILAFCQQTLIRTTAPWLRFSYYWNHTCTYKSIGQGFKIFRCLEKKLPLNYFEKADCLRTYLLNKLIFSCFSQRFTNISFNTFRPFYKNILQQIYIIFYRHPDAFCFRGGLAFSNEFCGRAEL